MPRGQKSKRRTRQKRLRVRAETQTQGLEGAQAIAVEEGAPNLSGHPLPEGSPQYVPAAETPSTPREPPETQSSTDDAPAAVSCNDSNEGASQQGEEIPESSAASVRFRSDPLNKKVVWLVQFLLKKYQNKEPITKADMLKFVIKRYKYHYNEILKRASEFMELAFGVELKEVDPIRHRYAFVRMLEFTFDGAMNEENMSKTGLLMIVLGVIFMKGNCAPEEAIWEVLNLMGVYADQKHLIYGDAKKVITEYFVQLQYLESRQVPHSDPPRYEFRWGPRAHAETTKMKILEFLAKIHNSVPSAFPLWYEEALRDEEERAQARAAARVQVAASASSEATASRSSLPK